MRAYRKSFGAADYVWAQLFRNFVLQRKPTRPLIAAALMPFGAFSGRGWLFSFVFQETTRSGSSMAVRLPTLEQIDNLGSDFGLVLTNDEVVAFQQAFKGPLASYGRLDELVPPALAPIAPRSPGYRPAPADNPYGAWYWKPNIRTRAEGLLSGKKIAIKDNICVAGVPMMNGSVLLEGYVPELDAT